MGKRGRSRMTRGLVACALALGLPGCQKGSPTNQSPTVSISRSPDGVVIAGATGVLFTAVASDANGDALTLAWDLGDGQTATGASVVHVYASEGVFPVALTVSDGRGGLTSVGSSVTAGNLIGRWLLSEGGERFYEWGFDITQGGSTLGGRPYSVPDKRCLGDLHGRVISPLTVRFEFGACDNNTVVIDGVASGDLRRITGTYTHPDDGPQPMVLTRY
jgi:hypothetical protein